MPTINQLVRKGRKKILKKVKVLIWKDVRKRKAFAFRL